MSPRPSAAVPKVSFSKTHFLSFLLLFSLGLNAYWVFVAPNRRQDVLAAVGGEKFYLGSLSSPAANSALREEAERWVEAAVLSKEASSRKTTTEDLLKKEALDKVQVSQAQVYQRYVHSPSADALPYPQVLKDIESEMRAEAARRLENIFVEKLYPKYDVNFYVHKPKGLPAPSTTRFPVYHATPGVPDVSAEGKVVNPPSQGPATAPVVIEVYSDFMCPFSHRFFSVLQPLRAQYPEKVRVAFRQFPLPMHEGSHLMSEASTCAQEQGKFWEYHDRLMGGDTAKKDKAALTALAQASGLDVPKFQSCLDSGKYVSWVDSEIQSGKARGATGTPSFFVNGRMSVGAQPLESLKPLVEWHLKPEGRYPGVKNPSQKPSGSAGCGSAGSNLDPDRVYSFPPEWLKIGPSMGPEKPGGTILEFLDYNCPFCRQGSQTVAGLLKKYPDEFRVVAKTFPLPMHPNAFKTAQAALCAEEQGKFWEYRAQIFGDSWGKSSPEDLKSAAKKIGLNEAYFVACLDSDKTKGLVTKDVEVGKSVGVQGTPTYFIDGKPLTGAQSLENFEAALRKKK